MNNKLFDELRKLTASARSKITSVIKSGSIEEAGKNALRSAITDIDSIEEFSGNIVEACKLEVEKLTQGSERPVTAESIREYITKALGDAAKRGVIYSVIIFDIRQFTKYARTAWNGAASSIIIDMESLIKASLRRRADLVLREKDYIYVILPETEPEEARIVASRLKDVLMDYIATKKVADSAKIDFRIASSLNGPKTFEDMIRQAE